MDLSKHLESLKLDLSSSLIIAEVASKKVEISVSVSKSIQKIKDLPSMGILSPNDAQSITLLEDL